MKKIIMMLVICCLIMGGTACSDNGTDETAQGQMTEEEKPEGINSDIYTYGTKALEAVDLYLDAEIEKEEAYEILNSMSERIGEDNDSIIKNYIYGLEGNFDIKEDETLNIEDIKKGRDDLAGAIGSSLRYRDTVMATLNITQEDFIENYNAMLEQINTNLVIDNFETTEQREEAMEYWSVTGENNDIKIVIFVDGKSDKINSFRMFVNKEINENTIEDVITYFLAASQVLNPELDLDVLDKNLVLTDFEDGSLELYETKEATYGKSVLGDSSIILDIVAK